MSTNNTPPRAQSRLGYEQSGRALQQQAPKQNTALARVNEHKSFLDARLPKIAAWVTQGVRPEALVRFALRDMSAPTDAAAKLRACTEESIYLGLLACAVTGLEPGSLKGEAYLVPFKGEATFMVGYRGIIKQARRSRDVVALWSNVVFEGDDFEVDLGSANRIVHRPRFGSRGDNIIAAYAIARLANGQDEIELMDRADLDHVREAGNQGPAWKEWGDQMMRKAPIRRLGKRLPLGADYYVALALDNARTPDEQRNIIDVETSGEPQQSETSARIAEEMRNQAGEQLSEEDLIRQQEAEQARKEAGRP